MSDARTKSIAQWLERLQILGNFQQDVGVVLWGTTEKKEKDSFRALRVNDEGELIVGGELVAERTNRTEMAEVDLTVARSDYVSVGLEVSGRVYRWLTIERCDDKLNYKLKQTNGELSNIFRAYEGARIFNHDFLDIYVSNPAGTGVCRFIVGYWEG